jgi:putative transposon-encoded protein
MNNLALSVERRNNYFRCKSGGEWFCSTCLIQKHQCVEPLTPPNMIVNGEKGARSTYRKEIIMEPMEVTTRAYEVIERPVKSMGNSGGIYLPKDWIGKKVKVLLIEPV